MELQPPGEHEVLVFLAAFLVLLAVAKALGGLARRIGQPEVVGELAAGLLLGPSVLGRLAPDVEEWLFPADDVQTAMLFTVSWLGVIFLLLVTGFETDLGLIRRLGRAAGVVSTGSLLVPMAFGLAVGLAMPSSFLGSDDRTAFALFMAAALSISSLPVIAKILTDMGYLRRDFGQLTLAAGMANDVVGWIALGVIAGLVSAGSISVSGVVTTLAGVAGFFVVAFTAGQWAIDTAFRALRRLDADQSSQTTVLVGFTLAGALATQWLGVEAVLGAFVVGVVVGRSPFRDAKVIEPVENAASAYLAPVFFATAGLRVDLGLLGETEVIVWTLVVVAVASLSKFLGALGGAWVARLPSREGAALGVALNARGALEIVIASVGLSLGILNVASYTAVVVMAMGTSMMAPPLLRTVLRGWAGTTREQERLRREEALAANLVVRADRLLLPSRGGSPSVLAAQVLDLAWPPDVPVTVLTAGPGAGPAALVPVTGSLANRDATVELAVDAPEVAGAILAEAKLGYGAVVMGMHELGDDRQLPPVVQAVLREARIPVVLVRLPQNLVRHTPWAFARALVPVAGTRTARAAQEVAFGISAVLGTETVIAHVTRPRAADGGSPPGPLGPLGGPAVAGGILTQASEAGLTAGARVLTVERTAASAAGEILDLAAFVAADLVVLGATRRSVGGDGVFLGHTVTEVLAECPATVVTVVLPDEPVER